MGANSAVCYVFSGVVQLFENEEGCRQDRDGAARVGLIGW